jgi:hypothetical protein
MVTSLAPVIAVVAPLVVLSLSVTPAGDVLVSIGLAEEVSVDSLRNLWERRRAMFFLVNGEFPRRVDFLPDTDDEEDDAIQMWPYHMRLCQVQCRGLFGWHDLDMPLEKPMTYLIGPGGGGKTNLLRLVQYFITNFPFPQPRVPVRSTGFPESSLTHTLSPLEVQRGYHAELWFCRSDALISRPVHPGTEIANPPPPIATATPWLATSGRLETPPDGNCAFFSLLLSIFTRPGVLASEAAVSAIADRFVLPDEYHLSEEERTVDGEVLGQPRMPILPPEEGGSWSLRKSLAHYCCADSEVAAGRWFRYPPAQAAAAFRYLSDLARYLRAVLALYEFRLLPFRRNNSQSDADRLKQYRLWKLFEPSASSAVQHLDSHAFRTLASLFHLYLKIERFRDDDDQLLGADFLDAIAAQNQEEHAHQQAKVFELDLPPDECDAALLSIMPANAAALPAVHVQGTSVITPDLQWRASRFPAEALASPELLSAHLRHVSSAGDSSAGVSNHFIGLPQPTATEVVVAASTCVTIASPALVPSPAAGSHAGAGIHSQPSAPPMSVSQQNRKKKLDKAIRRRQRQEAERAEKFASRAMAKISDADSDISGAQDAQLVAADVLSSSAPLQVATEASDGTAHASLSGDASASVHSGLSAAVADDELEASRPAAASSSAHVEDVPGPAHALSDRLRHYLLACLRETLLRDAAFCWMRQNQSWLKGEAALALAEFMKKPDRLKPAQRSKLLCVAQNDCRSGDYEEGEEDKDPPSIVLFIESTLNEWFPLPNMQKCQDHSYFVRTDAAEEHLFMMLVQSIPSTQLNTILASVVPRYASIEFGMQLDVQPDQRKVTLAVGDAQVDPLAWADVPATWTSDVRICSPDGVYSLKQLHELLRQRVHQISCTFFQATVSSPSVSVSSVQQPWSLSRPAAAIASLPHLSKAVWRQCWEILNKAVLLVHRDEGLVYCSTIVQRFSDTTRADQLRALATPSRSSDSHSRWGESMNHPGVPAHASAGLASPANHGALYSTMQDLLEDTDEAASLLCTINALMARFFNDEFVVQRIPQIDLHGRIVIRPQIGFRTIRRATHVFAPTPTVLTLDQAPGSVQHALVLFAALARARAAQALSVGRRKVQDFGTILLDEPGSMWHPTHQKQLGKFLESLAFGSTGSAGRSVTMLVITHSPSMIDLVQPMASIMRLAPHTSDTHIGQGRETRSAVGSVTSPDKSALSQLGRTAFRRLTVLDTAQLHENSDGELQYLRSFHSRSLLFADCVLLVEGKHDQAFLMALQRSAHMLQLADRNHWSWFRNLLFLPNHGSDPHALPLLIACHIPCAALIDADGLDGVSRNPSRFQASVIADNVDAMLRSLSSVAQGTLELGLLCNQFPHCTVSRYGRLFWPVDACQPVARVVSQFTSKIDATASQATSKQKKEKKTFNATKMHLWEFAGRDGNHTLVADALKKWASMPQTRSTSWPSAANKYLLGAAQILFDCDSVRQPDEVKCGSARWLIVRAFARAQGVFAWPRDGTGSFEQVAQVKHHSTSKWNDARWDRELQVKFDDQDWIKHKLPYIDDLFLMLQERFQPTRQRLPDEWTLQLLCQHPQQDFSDQASAPRAFRAALQDQMSRWSVHPHVLLADMVIEFARSSGRSRLHIIECGCGDGLIDKQLRFSIHGKQPPIEIASYVGVDYDISSIAEFSSMTEMHPGDFSKMVSSVERADVYHVAVCAFSLSWHLRTSAATSDPDLSAPLACLNAALHVLREGGVCVISDFTSHWINEAGQNLLLLHFADGERVAPRRHRMQHHRKARTVKPETSRRVRMVALPPQPRRGCFGFTVVYHRSTPHCFFLMLQKTRVPAVSNR